MSSLATENHFVKVDTRGRIPIPEKFRNIMQIKRGSWIELELHVVDNTPAVIATLAKGNNRH